MENTKRMRSKLTSDIIRVTLPLGRENNHMKKKNQTSCIANNLAPAQRLGNKWRSFNNIEGQTGP